MPAGPGQPGEVVRYAQPFGSIWDAFLDEDRGVAYSYI